MPTARVSPAPTNSASKAYSSRVNHANTGRRASSSNAVATLNSINSNGVSRNINDIEQKRGFFGFGQRITSQCGVNYQNAGFSKNKNRTQNVLKIIKNQSTSESDKSNSSSGSSNHFNFGNSSCDNDIGSANVTRTAWSNCGSEQKNGSATNGVSLFGFSSLSPYQKVLKSLSEDDRWHREITLGRRIGFYRFRGEIGNGNFSQVKVALHMLTKEKVAVKILDKSKLDVKTQRMLSREISSMEKLHHPNLVRLFEVIETFSKIYLVIEFAAGGELFQRISSDGKFDEQAAKPLFAQIVSAIDHMHQHHIIHRDIKAENVFFSDPKTVKVGDFGFSTEIKSRQEKLNTFCGSPPYAAPELFSDESYEGPYVDLWALGVLLYFMVTAMMPFKAQTVSALKKLILEGDYVMPELLSDDCLYIINGLLQLQSNTRLSIKQLRESVWLREQPFPISVPKYKVSQGIKEKKQETLEETSEECTKMSSAISPGNDKTDVSNGDGLNATIPNVAIATTNTNVVSASVSLVTAKVKTKSERKKSTSFLSSDESEAYRQLSLLGITETMINESREKGVRSNIIGTYRIVLHRIVSSRCPTLSKHQQRQRSAISSADSRISQRNSRDVSVSAKSTKRITDRLSQNSNVTKVVGYTSDAKNDDRKDELAASPDSSDHKNENNEEVKRTFMKSCQKSNKSIISTLPTNRTECVNNNTPTTVCAANTTLYCGGVAPGKPLLSQDGCCSCDLQMQHCCPCRPLTNNYFSAHNNFRKTHDKKRWKTRKFTEGCSVL